MQERIMSVFSVDYFAKTENSTTPPQTLFLKKNKEVFVPCIVPARIFTQWTFFLHLLYLNIPKISMNNVRNEHTHL